MKSGAALQAAGIAGAVALVAGTGLASAFFVDYLADRAMARTGAQSGIEAAAATPAVAPVVRKPTVEATAQIATAPLAREQTVQTANAPAVPRPASGGRESSVADADDLATDRTFTAAIAQPAREAVAPAPLPVIEEAEIITDGRGEQAAIAAKELPEVAEEPAEPTRSAKVTKYVNLRAGPNDESRVLTVVPARDTVQVVNCDSWCEVEFKGQKGFIYKSFIDG